jgi:hypothetical protein
MGVRPLLSLRGSRHVVKTALSLGADVLTEASARSIVALAPDIVVVDDPIASAARRWIAAARRVGAVVVTIHDLGIGEAGGDVVIDGSVTRHSRPRAGRVGVAGARYAVLPPAPAGRQPRASGDGRRVLVALGGGPRRTTALAIAEAISATDPRAEVRIAGGFSALPASSARNITWIAPVRGLGRELSMATVAVVGGGVSLYEACAAGVPSVAVPVVRSQVPTVRAFARRGAALGMPFSASEGRTAAAVVALLDDPRRRAVIQRRALRLVDGRGASRAAAAVLAFVGRRLS